MERGYDKIAIPLPGPTESWLVLCCAAGDFDSSVDDCTDTPTGQWMGRSSPKPTIAVVEDHSGVRIRLAETKIYQWAVEGEAPASDITSSLDHKHRKRWNVRRRNGRVDSGEFCVINHLGYASFGLVNEHGDPLVDVRFEFISPKLDFDTEYRRMTEDIATFCEQLLLNWQAPTSLSFNANPAEERKLLLEQFLFLRHFLTEERIGRLLEVIAHHPHTQLIKEREWKPAAAARSHDYLQRPDQMLRGWRGTSGSPIPGEVMDVRKADTHNTAPNRFIKFALGSFRRICSEVMDQQPDTTPAREAADLIVQLDALLAKRFFRSIGRMQRLPLDNQTLQKREGYREILCAWILTQAASTLDWTGNEDCYQGETRDVATLYEYWIFLKLHGILENLPGMSHDGDTVVDAAHVDEFVAENQGRLEIKLKSGKQSRSRFRWTGSDGTELFVHLHYERTFSEGAGATASGSYSRRFRPDYTLTIFPATVDGVACDEKAAETKGLVSHLHFDAKYRAEKLRELFGDEPTSDEQGELTEEKQEAKATSTYKRGDLLKMHTYNDALRHSVGSYVLYPGENGQPVVMHKFHEIAPGVGAFVMKPGNDQCLAALSGFLDDIIKHQADQFTQYRYLSDKQHETVEKKPDSIEEGEATYRIARLDAPCVMLWLRDQDMAVYKAAGFAYCRAISDDQPDKLSLDLSIETGSEFIPCGGNWTGPLKTVGWRAKVKGARFISKERLTEYIEEARKKPGLENIPLPSSADHYLLFEFSSPTHFTVVDIDAVHRTHRSGSKFMAVTCKWSEILTCINESQTG